MSGVSRSIRVENVVASSDIGQELDLATLAGDLLGTEYTPGNFPGLVYRMQEPKAAAVIFRSGKVVCTGANSIENARRGLKHVFAELWALGVAVADSPESIVQNIVSSADLDTSLNAIAIGLGLEHVEYEPEQFPGLVYRLDAPKVVVFLFGSGKLVITGEKQPADAEQTLSVIEARLTDLGLLE